MARARKARIVGTRCGDLVEIVIGRCPEISTPGKIERIDRLVAISKIAPEFSFGRFGIGRRRCGVELVVGLPADDMRIVAIVVGKRSGDPAAVHAVDRTVGVGMLARAMGCDAVILVNPQYFRIGRRQPPRWRCCRRAEDCANTMGAQNADRLVEE
jgi:hypothetical protein